MSRLAPSLRSLFSAIHRRRRTTPADPVRRACAPVARRLACDLENLEQRRLLSTVSIIGTSGNDTISLSVDGSGYVVQTVNGTPTNLGFLASSVTSISVDGGAGGDNIDLSAVTTANGFTSGSLPGNVTLTGGTGNDTITGSGLADSIVGGDGEDVLYGNAGDDTIGGGADNDGIYGNAGNDSLDGGTGVNSVIYDSDPAAITATFNVSATDGYGDTDTLANFNQLYGTIYNDLLYANSSGNSVLLGQAGDDTLIGGAGNDIFFPGAGNDVVDGGGGFNSVGYQFDPAGVTVYNNNYAIDGYGDTDTLANIQGIHGSNFADLLVSSSASDNLVGHDGDDTLVSSGGVDNFDGGNGTDTLRIVGTAGNDTFSLSSSTVTIGSTTSTLTGIEAVEIAGGGGSDAFTLSSGSYTLAADGGAGGTSLAATVSGTLAVATAQHLSSVTINSGGSVSLAPGAGLFSTNALTVSGTGALDLADNAAIIDYTGSSPIAAIRAALASGYDAGAWDGAGINTSTGPAVGFAEASDALGISGASTASWEGATVDATSVLIRPTYYGDADLDGDVDAYDFARANDGVSDLALTYARTPGDRPDHAFWSNGDFNYDTNIDADDYALLYASAAADGTGVVDVSTLSGIHLDGATDDSATLQSAINAAPDGTIFLIPGTAALAGQLNVASRSNLVFLGTAPGAGFSMTADSPGSYSAFLHVDDSSYITLAGLTFDANAYSGSLVAVSYSDHATIRDSAFQNMDKVSADAGSNPGAVYAYGNAYDTFVHNTFDDVTRAYYAGVSFMTGGLESHLVITDNFIQYTNASAMGTEASYADIERNTVQHVVGGGSGMTISGGGEALIGDTTEHYTIRDNSFYDIAWTGIQADVWDSSATTAEPHTLDDVLIENNSIDTAGVSGIFVWRADTWTITGNTITNAAGGGIVGGGGATISISGNTISSDTTNDTYAAISMGSANWHTQNGRDYVLTNDLITIEDNVIVNDNPHGKGILIRADGTGASSADITISGNSVDGTLYAFSVSGSDTADISNVTIDDNTVTDAANGLQFAFVTGITIEDLSFTNNTVDTPSGFGAGGYLTTGASISGFTVDSNTITDPGASGIVLEVDSGASATDVSITNNTITGAGSTTNAYAIFFYSGYNASYAAPSIHATIQGNTLHVHDSDDKCIMLQVAGGTSLSHPDIYATIDNGNDFAGSPYGVYCLSGGFGSSSIHLNSDIDNTGVNVWDSGVTHHVTGP